MLNVPDDGLEAAIYTRETSLPGRSCICTALFLKEFMYPVEDSGLRLCSINLEEGSFWGETLLVGPQ